MNHIPLVRRNFRWVVVPVAFLAAGTMAVHHLGQIVDGLTSQELIFAASFLWLLFVAVLPYFHKDVTLTAEQREQVSRLRINVMIPAHNEDPEMFMRGLDSLVSQTVMPHRIHVVENGYAERKLEAAFNEWVETSCPPGVEALYDLLPNPSKREAQVFAWQQDPTADIWATVDSDVQLDPGAIENGIAPFIDERVTSVAGLLIGLNHRTNLLTRLVEGPYVNSSIGGRAAYSLLKSVNVNCGALAFYRASAVSKYLDHYLNHTVLGRRFSYGDDAMMTRYALNEGHAVMQNSSWGYTLHPVNITHLTKQRLRWWRSYYWGNEWLLSFFSPKTPIWWLTAFKFASLVGYTIVIPMVIIQGLVHGFSFGFLIWGVLAAGLLSQLRYFMIKRPDESFWSQLYTVALSPLSSLLHVYLGFGLAYVGLITFLKTGWSTRKTIEVGAGAGSGSAEDTVVLKRRHARPVPAWRRYVIVSGMAAFIALASGATWAAMGHEENIVPPVASPALNEWLRDKPLPWEPWERPTPSPSPSASPTATSDGRTAVEPSRRTGTPARTSVRPSSRPTASPTPSRSRPTIGVPTLPTRTSSATPTPTESVSPTQSETVDPEPTETGDPVVDPEVTVDVVGAESSEGDEVP